MKITYVQQFTYRDLPDDFSQRGRRLLVGFPAGLAYDANFN